MNRSAVRPACLLALLTLAACSPKAEKPPEPESIQIDSLAGVDLNAPLTVTGTEPFWSLTLTGDEATFERPGEEARVFPRQEFEINKDKEGPARAELLTNELSLTLIAQKCSDGMSDRVYPLTAEINMSDEVLKGCAVTTAALEKDRP